ncbi:RTA1 like protein-domain-containing protein [Aspergillus alliaceus]|uniref:RTA1 like protein-domain-containing protein n=1 Tax=Petromyces alliaceus TaxID=209559 RepID=A0A5N7C5K7_PETAA|nr:RTA1 like protein-domain-containing protein [Aspergillus alliaceus]
MEFTFYYYTPSAAAGGIFVALFGLATILHLYQLLRTRTWFMIPFAIGGILETIGYVGRALSSKEAPNFTKGPYVMQSALILIAPAFLAASIYMTLGRIIAMLQAERYSVIPLRWLTKIFVAGDVLSFLMQASGAGIMVKDSTDPTTGEHIIIGGLFVQIIFFGFFVITAIVFELRMAKKRIGASAELGRIWRRHMIALYVTSLLVLVRSIVRVVEYLDGYDGYLMKHEVFIYVFDALLMFIAMLVLSYIHPSQVNSLLDRGEQYFENFLVRRKFAPTSTVEMVVDNQA